MKGLTRKRLIMIAVAVLVVLAVAYGFMPKPVLVETAAITRGSLQVIVEDEGETQVKHRYVVTSPVMAFARRIEMKAGDWVAKGQELVRLEPPRPTILDPRTAAEAQQRVKAAEAMLSQAEEQVRATTAAAANAEEERARTERLFESGSATQQLREQTRSVALQAVAQRDAATAAVEAARADLASARAVVAYTEGSGAGVRQTLRAPTAGTVLAVYRESEGQVMPGEALMEIGDVDSLEVRVDVLSQDAVRIRPGTHVMLDRWGGEGVLKAVVTRVEPQGVTTVSSLGVEEKRVAVVADLVSPAAHRAGLGSGFRVLAQFVIWESDDVLLAPTSALFREDGGWAAFVDEGGKAVKRAVEIGHQAGLTAEVLSGLSEGDEVIVHPPNNLEEGVGVEAL
ncbi:MAG: efflux RND transporter periplasmic adaptor subunit [Rhodothermales bacterium]|nr:efflux RND transporter periplasmic adaptor subunit [Rhodothermales bacterium]